MEHFESLYPPNTRDNEIGKILTYIKEGNSCQTIGLPGGGRSNLLGLLSYNRNVRLKHLGENQKWFHFVLLNFSEIRNKPLIEAIRFIFLGLIDSLEERQNSFSSVIPDPIGNPDRGLDSRFRGNDKRVINDPLKTIKAIFNEVTSSNDDLILFHGLKRVIDFLAIEKELTVVFLFDRFEDYISTASPEFFTNLRVLRDRAKYRFSVVFSLHKPLEDLIGEDILLDFYQFVAGHTVYLPLLDKPGLDFRISYIEKASGKTLDKKLIDDILARTAGHPNLTRLSVEAVLESNQQSATSNQGLGTFLLSQKPIKAALFDIWKSLTPAEQIMLNVVILNEVKNLKPSEILRSAQDDKVHSQGDNQGRYLENVGLIKNNKITIPIFAQFVKQFSKASTYISFDPNTLSDSLTSSEFKLLTYLMQNNNRIIEREEIINAVWADNKSNSGVTDQALDQLIFRLRKKIEDDPNNPTHLQTVKGRGFRFTP